MELLGWPYATENQALVLKQFANASIVHNLEETIIVQTIELRKAYKIKLPDAIIAATALESGLALISRNIKDFKNIANLKLIDPYR